MFWYPFTWIPAIIVIATATLANAWLAPVALLFFVFATLAVLAVLARAAVSAVYELGQRRWRERSRAKAIEGSPSA